MDNFHCNSFLPSSSQFFAHATSLCADLPVPPAVPSRALRKFAVVRVGIVFWRVIVARLLLAFVGAHAIAFVIDVTRLLAPSGSFAVTVAVVHFVDNFSVGEREPLLFSDRVLIVRILRDHSQIAICGERVAFIMHDGAIIVFDAKVVRVVLFLKIVLVVFLDVVPQNLEIAVSVHATLFVMETDGMAEFVERSGMICASIICQTDLLESAVRIANGRVAAAVTENGGCVVVAHFSSDATRRGLENDACLIHPFLHGRVDVARFLDGPVDSVRNDTLWPSIVIADDGGAGKCRVQAGIVIKRHLQSVHFHVQLKVSVRVSALRVLERLSHSFVGDISGLHLS